MNEKNMSLHVSMNVPAWYQDPEFLAWLENSGPSQGKDAHVSHPVATWHRRGATPNEYSDAFMLVDARFDGQGSEQGLMPDRYWMAIIETCRRSIQSSPLRGLLGPLVSVQLTNLDGGRGVCTPGDGLIIPDEDVKVSLRIHLDRPEWFRQDDFWDWVNDEEGRVAAQHERGNAFTEFSSVFTMVDPALESGDESERMPSWCWRAITDDCCTVILRSGIDPQTLTAYLCVQITNGADRAPAMRRACETIADAIKPFPETNYRLGFADALESISRALFDEGLNEETVQKALRATTDKCYLPR
jgi:hypothetical protein